MASDLQGLDQANPVSMLMSAVQMLEHLGLTDKAKLIGDAVCGVVRDGQHRTRDLGGTTSTSAFCEAVMSRL